MKSAVTTVTTTAAIIIAAIGNVAYPQSAIIKVPTGGATVYVGGLGVTTAIGFPIAAGESISVDLVGEALYAIVAASTQVVNILRRGD